MSTKYDYFYGIRGIRFIWHGTNADPELCYLGKVVNYYAVEGYFWELYKDENPGKSESELEDSFRAWIKSNGAQVKNFIRYEM